MYERLLFVTLVLVLLSFLNYPLVKADWCYDTNTLSTNISVNVSGSDLKNVSINIPCPSGCDETRGICRQNFFGIDIMLFIFFEAVAFVFLIISVLRVRSAYSLFPPVIACLMFFILAWLSGFITTGGELNTSLGALWINMGLATISILFVVDSMFEETKESFNEQRRS